MNPVVQVVSVRGTRSDSPEARNVVYCARKHQERTDLPWWPHDHPLAVPRDLARELADADKDDESKRRPLLAKYRDWLLARPTLDADLARLWADTECGKKALACWCRPQRSCHCDILQELLTERFGRKEPA